MDTPHIAVIVPCYNEASRVRAVVERIPEYVRSIIAIDDASSDDTARVLDSIEDSRLTVVRHTENQGVGAATRSGYAAALRQGADICVKMDGDGQMAEENLPALLRPLLEENYDFAKGNRFIDLAALASMPRIRLIGNGMLSFMCKLVTGYWSLFDPTNGLTAISADMLRRLDFTRLSPRYFFEISMLLELGLKGAQIRDVAMPAVYEGNKSSLRIRRVLWEFPPLLIRGLMRRFFWQYLLLDFNTVTILVLGGLPLLLFGFAFGMLRWWRSTISHVPATAGTVVLATLPFMLGFQCLLVALVMDVLAESSRRNRAASHFPKPLNRT